MAGKRKLARMMLVFLWLLPVAALSLYLLNTRGIDSLDPRLRIIGYSVYRVASNAMSPGLVNDEVVFVHAALGPGKQPQRGDVVIFREQRSGYAWIKRVVGLPGERIALRKGRLLIDGNAVPEPYVDPDRAVSAYSREMPEQTIPAGRYFLLGDYRDNSEDSRIMGPIEGKTLMGQVVGKLGNRN